MLKKILGTCCVLSFLLVSSFFTFFGCCSNGFSVEVAFLNPDEELGLFDYTEYVSFEDGYTVTFTIPAGFDHTGISAISSTQDGTNLSKTLDYSMKIIDPLAEVDDEHIYSVDREFSYSIHDIKRNMKIEIDMSKVYKRTFDITLNNLRTEEYSVVWVDYDESDGYLTSITNDNIKEFENGSKELIFNDKNKVTVNFGTTVALIQNQSNRKLVYDKLYTTDKYFSSSNQNRLNEECCYYNVASNGGGYYSFNRDTDKKIYFIGDVKEDIDLYSNIPGYEEEKGIKFEDEENMRNVFRLLAPKQKYNSETFKLFFYMPKKSESDIVFDKVDDIELVQVPSEMIGNYNNKYDIYNVYLGDDYNNDIYMTEDIKKNICESLYIRMETETPLSIDGLVKLYLIAEDNTKMAKYPSDPFLSFDRVGTYTQSGYTYTYARLSRATMLNNFSVSRPNYVNGENIEYYKGCCILAPQIADKYGPYVSQNYVAIIPEMKFEGGFDSSKFQMEIFVKDDEGNVDYGFIDNHRWDIDKNLVVDKKTTTHKYTIYFHNDRLFNSSDTFLNNIYVRVVGPEYSGIFQPLIDYYNVKKIDEAEGNNVLTPHNTTNNREGIVSLGRENAMIDDSLEVKLVGINGSKIKTSDLSFTIFVTASSYNSTKYSVNFEEVEMDNNENLLFSNSVNLNGSTYIDVNKYNKSTIEEVKIGCGNSLYYFSTTNEDFDFYYKDTNGEYIKISETATLYDITGRKIKVSFNGANYEVKIKYLKDIFDKNPNNVYYAKSNN